MQNVFWVIEDQLAGRPGPSKEPWSVQDLREAGFDAILNLSEHPSEEGELAAAGWEDMAVRVISQLLAAAWRPDVGRRGGSVVEMHVEIVDADFDNAAHRAGILEVLNSYAADPVGGGEPLAPDVRERLVPALRDHPTGLVLLAIGEERPVGIAVCFLGFSTFRARPLLNIHDLAVLQEWRGKGVGRALLAAAEDRARRRGCCKLTLEVQDDNGWARALYESFGFSDLVMGDSGPTRFLTKPLGAPTSR